MGSADRAAGAGPPRLIWLLIDRADFSIVDNWDVIGAARHGLQARRLRGRASSPSTASLRRSGRRRAAAGLAHATRTRCTPAGCSRLLFFEFGAIAVGAARGAIDVYEDVLRTKPIDIPPFVLRGEIDEYQHHLGEAVGLVDVAEAALLEGTDRYLEQAARARTRPTSRSTRTARRRGACSSCSSSCIRLCVEAVELLFRTGGTSSARDGQPARQRDAGADRHAHPHGPAAGPHGDEPRAPAARHASRASYEHARRAHRRRRRSAPAPARRAGRDGGADRATRRSCTRRSASSASTGCCSRAATAAWSSTCPPSTA